MSKKEKEKIERLIIKLPKTMADYFRAEFPHGKRSDFVADCLMKRKREQEVKKLEEELRQVGKARQNT